MSIDALVSGTLWKKPEARRTSAGKPFATASVRAAAGDGEVLFVSVVAFSDSAQRTLLAMDDGDSVSLAGSLKIGTYEARDGSVKPNVSIVASKVLTAYHVQRKRKTVAEVPASERRPRQSDLPEGELDFP